MTDHQDSADGSTNFDVLIIGAGLSGINAAYRLQTQAPTGTTYAIIEARNSIGGTWDLFRYPGIRSDSDIFSFGFAWSPWYRKEYLAEGPDIRQYAIDSAKAEGIEQHIRYQHTVLSANWDTKAKRWELTVQKLGLDKPTIYRSRFIFLGTGYYDFHQGRQTDIPGIHDFQGTVIHPQFWPNDFDYTGKDVVVIGSGATAITIVPSIADKVKRVTMLQRSPTYILPIPNRSKVRDFLFAVLPRSIVHKVNRATCIFLTYFMSVLCSRYPDTMRNYLRRAITKVLPDSDLLNRHFTPRYNPWEQRLCVCPEGDIFAAVRSAKATVVTDTIQQVTKDTIKLTSGNELHPDVIVTATGIKLLFGGGIKFTKDGDPFEQSRKFVWKGAMIQDLPNIVFALGYLKSGSWTLGAECAVQLLIRLMKNMDKEGLSIVTPHLGSDHKMDAKPLFGLLNSTYIKGSEKQFPQTGTGVWCNRDNYIKDRFDVVWGDVKTDLRFE